MNKEKPKSLFPRSLSYKGRMHRIRKSENKLANSTPTNNRDEIALFHAAAQKKYGSLTRRNPHFPDKTPTSMQLLFGNSKGDSHMVKDIANFFQPTIPHERANKRSRSPTSHQLRETKSRKLSAASAAAKLRHAILNPPSY